jgi:hypothetical protein
LRTCDVATKAFAAANTSAMIKKLSLDILRNSVTWGATRKTYA